MKPGMSYLGGAKYPDLILKEHPTGYAARTFYSLFGPTMPLARKLLETQRCPLWSSQIIYEKNHTYIPEKHDPLIRAAIKELNKLKLRFPDKEIEASPFCEHEIRGAKLQHLINLCQNTGRGITFVNNPEPGKGDLVPNMRNEIHSLMRKLPGVYDFDYDGLSCVDSNVQEFKDFHSSANLFWYWDSTFNGKKNDKETTPIPERTHYPSSKRIDSIIYYKNLKGDTKLDKGVLYKSHSEWQAPPDARSEHPMVMMKPKVDAVLLVARNGQIIDTLKRYKTPFTDGRWRYYATRWGFELADKAMRIQGSAIVRVMANGKSPGTINLGYRENEYRNTVKE